MSTTFSSKSTNLPQDIIIRVERKPTTHYSIRNRFEAIHPTHGLAVMQMWGDECKQVSGDWELSEQDTKVLNAFTKKSHQILIGFINGEEDSSFIQTTKALYVANRD